MHVSLKYSVDRARNSSNPTHSVLPSMMRTLFAPALSEGPAPQRAVSRRRHKHSPALSEGPAPQRAVSRRRHKHSPSKRRRHMLWREWRRLARMDDDLFILPCPRPTSPQEPDLELYLDVDLPAVLPVIPMTVLDEQSVHAVVSLSPSEQEDVESTELPPELDENVDLPPILSQNDSADQFLAWKAWMCSEMEADPLLSLLLHDAWEDVPELDVIARDVALEVMEQRLLIRPGYLVRRSRSLKHLWKHIAQYFNVIL